MKDEVMQLAMHSLFESPLKIQNVKKQELNCVLIKML